MATPKTSAQRVDKLRTIARLKGRKRREYYLTAAEHDALRTYLTALRAAEKR